MPQSENLQRLLENQRLIQTSMDGFWIVRTRDARILEVNDAFCNMVGYTREELLSMCISDLEINESPVEIAAHIRNIIAVGYDRFETRYRHKLGHQVHLEVSVSCAGMNGETHFVFVRDITERKRIEEALYFIAQRGWQDNDGQFFNSLAQYLGTTLDVDYVVIDRLGASPDTAETIALYADGAIVRNISYDLKGTPCENVMGKEFCLYSQGVQRIFPEDALLVEMGAESYAGIPLWDSAGQAVGLIAVMDRKPFVDEIAISRLLQLVAIRAAAELERERSDYILRERERKYRTLAESMPDNLIRYDLHGRVQYMNPALRSCLSPEVLPVQGELITETFPDSDAVLEYQRVIERVVATGKPSEIEVNLPNQRGEMRTHHICYVAERDDAGEIIGALAIGRDITERKLDEKKLLESESRFRTLFEFATDCMLILDMAGRIVDINRTGYERLGYVKQEMLGRKIAEFDTPEYAIQVSERMARLSKDGNAVFESAHVRKDGTVMPVEISCRVIHLDGVQRYFSVIRDITERKHTERQLRELTAHLVSVREEEKARLAREIHDDLGSTLVALKLKLSLLLDVELSGNLNKNAMFSLLESMSPLLEGAIAATRRIITDMRPDVLDNLGLFAALKWQSVQFHKHTGIACSIVCINEHGCDDCKMCECQVDSTLSINLFRIFQEALSNVARHSGASSVAAEYRPGSDSVFLSVSDNGCGLPEGHKPSSTSFGLRGMRERVGQLGGQIKFDSPLGGGLSVTVRLPLSAASS